MEQLFAYQYLFKYPDLFKTEIIKFNKDQYLVRFELTQEFYQFGLINSKIKLMSHNYYLDIEDLNTFNISDGFILYEKIVSNYFYTHFTLLRAMSTNYLN